jgi:hypothetical protein
MTPVLNEPNTILEPNKTPALIPMIHALNMTAAKPPYMIVLPIKTNLDLKIHITATQTLMTAQIHPLTRTNPTIAILTQTNPDLLFKMTDSINNLLNRR